MGRPGGMQAKTFSTKVSARPRCSTCVTPTTLEAINPVDIPDELNQYSMSIGAPIVEGQDLLLRDRRLHAAGSHDVPVADAAVVRAAGRRSPRLRRPLSPGARATSASTIAVADAVADGAASTSTSSTTPIRNDAVAGTSAPSVARKYSRQSVDGAGQPHVDSRLAARQRSTRRVLEWRPRHAVGSRRAVDDLHARRDRCRSRSASRASRISSGGRCSSPTRCRGSRGKHTVRLGTSLIRHTSGGTGNEPGFADSRHVHVPEHDDGAVRSADAGGRAAVLAADQLRHRRATSSISGCYRRTRRTASA